MSIFEKLSKLRAKYVDTESPAIISEWEKMATEAFVVSNLKNNDGIMILITKYTQEIERLQNTLKTDPTLFNKFNGRDRGIIIHERIKWCKEFLRIFERADLRIKNIEESADRHLAE